MRASDPVMSKTFPADDLVEDEHPVRAASGAFAVGNILADKYRIERELAEGGLGVVVLATHIELGQKVAIKYLKPHILSNASLVERFKREAQLAASIRSDHVVRVYDVGYAPDGGPFMVMEFLEGEDLGGALRRGPLPVEEAVDYVIQACDALAEAHALGIVHRDLKPENLFLARRNNTSPIVKILDFGISKTYHRQKPAAGAPRVRQMTEPSERFGTPLYMSPEQLIKTQDVDVRTDIWSLGVLLYELVSGTMPFEGDSVIAYGANVVGTPATPLRARMPGAHIGLESVLSKCLEKNREARYRNVGELVVELVTLVSPGSTKRTDRIKRVVIDGGESIRPPRPLSQPIITLDEIPPIPMSSRLPATAKWAALGGTVGLVMLAAFGSILYLAKREPAPTPAPLVAEPLPPPLATTLATATASSAPPAVASSAPPAVASSAPSPPLVKPTAAQPAAPASVTPPPAKTTDYGNFGGRK